MVRLKNDFDALDELLNEEVEDSAAANTPTFVEERREDLAAKTARFAALLNMMIYISINQRRARGCVCLLCGEDAIDRSIEKLLESSPLF